MKEFIRISFDLDQCLRELAAFGALLESKQDLEEQADIKPFFEANQQLTAFVGSCYGWDVPTCDLLAFQYQLFGDFGCDLVVGDSRRKAFGFIEWEDATVGEPLSPAETESDSRMGLAVRAWFQPDRGLVLEARRHGANR